MRGQWSNHRRWRASVVMSQVFILNGASYDQRFLDATRTSSLSRADSSNPDSVAALNKDLDDCALLSNNKGKPLLASLAGGKTTDDGKLLIQAVVSVAPARVVHLPDYASEPYLCRAWQCIRLLLGGKTAKRR